MDVGNGGGGGGGGVGSRTGSGGGAGVDDGSRGVDCRLLAACSSRAAARGGSFLFLSMATREGRGRQAGGDGVARETGRLKLVLKLGKSS